MPQGPPGTGKTSAVVGIISAIVAKTAPDGPQLSNGVDGEAALPAVQVLFGFLGAVTVWCLKSQQKPGQCMLPPVQVLAFLCFWVFSRLAFGTRPGSACLTQQTESGHDNANKI